MIKYFYSIYDKAAETYSDPMMIVNDTVAKRGFQVECENKDSMIYQFPTDFTLMLVGSFDTKTGEVITIEPKPVCRGTDFPKGDN